jgi:AraC-like DNA-binding protein
LARLSKAEGVTTVRFGPEFSGMSFRHWRDQARALAALPSLIEGVPVTQVAIELGYETTGAFGAMFKRVMGVLPSLYSLRE